MDKEFRDTKRTSFMFPVRIGLEIDGEKKFFHAFSNDISQGGIKLSIQRDISVKEKLDLRFDLLNEDRFINQISTDAVITWKKEIKNGLFEYGIAFEKLPKGDWLVVLDFIKTYCLE